MKLELGKLGSESDTLGQKDAFHAPCVLVQCDVQLAPGDHIRFISNPDMVVGCPKHSKTNDGIVDPFLEFMIPPNTKFWMLLNPGTTSNLTHNFQIKKQLFMIKNDFEEECCGVEVNDDEPDECKAMGCN